MCKRVIAMVMLLVMGTAGVASAQLDNPDIPSEGDLGFLVVCLTTTDSNLPENAVELDGQIDGEIDMLITLLHDPVMPTSAAVVAEFNRDKVRIGGPYTASHLFEDYSGNSIFLEIGETPLGRAATESILLAALDLSEEGYTAEAEYRIRSNEHAQLLLHEDESSTIVEIDWAETNLETVRWVVVSVSDQSAGLFSLNRGITVEVDGLEKRQVNSLRRPANTITLDATSYPKQIKISLNNSSESAKVVVVVYDIPMFWFEQCAENGR